MGFGVLLEYLGEGSPTLGMRVSSSAAKHNDPAWVEGQAQGVLQRLPGHPEVQTLFCGCFGALCFGCRQGRCSHEAVPLGSVYAVQLPDSLDAV